MNLFDEDALRVLCQPGKVSLRPEDGLQPRIGFAQHLLELEPLAEGELGHGEQDLLDLGVGLRVQDGGEEGAGDRAQLRDGLRDA